MNYTNDESFLRRENRIIEEITRYEPHWLPLFMIEDKEALQELIDRWLVDVREIWNYKTPTAFLTNDLTRLQSLANLMFPLSQ